MQYLHNQGIIHRDLKPANIRFDNQNIIKVLDFGLATKLSPTDKNNDRNYKLNGGVGTCRYMAPEVAKCKPYNKLADVYSFGILMWQMLSLQVPFQGYNCIEWIKAVVFGGNDNRVLAISIENTHVPMLVREHK